MRAAPTVDAALSDGRIARALVVCLHGAAALVLIAWAASWQMLQTPPGGIGIAMLAALATLLCAVGLGRWQAVRLLPRQARRLVWRGDGWALADPGAVMPLTTVAVQLDLGSVLLLRLHGPAPQPSRSVTRWALATASAAGADWHGLRVALQHHAGASAPSAGSVRLSGAGAPR